MSAHISIINDKKGDLFRNVRAKIIRTLCYRKSNKCELKIHKTHSNLERKEI